MHWWRGYPGTLGGMTPSCLATKSPWGFYFWRENLKISEIKPYENNARYNKKAIPVVAESIKEFGFLGQIVLQSRENPVIVTGHTRVEACKLLK